MVIIRSDPDSFGSVDPDQKVQMKGFSALKTAEKRGVHRRHSPDESFNKIYVQTLKSEVFLLTKDA